MKGICFKEPLFSATVLGKKTQTRRIAQVPKNAVGLQIELRAIDKAFWGLSALNENGGTRNPATDQEWQIYPRYKVGEKIFLKEPYYRLDSGTIEYKYQPSFWLEGCVEPSWKWNNKLFMPASAARYFIMITGVRAELLQDISHEDCIKEGIVQGISSGGTFWGVKLTDGIYTSYSSTPRQAYAVLIDKINGNGTWDSNPIVWVYDYELVKI